MRIVVELNAGEVAEYKEELFAHIAQETIARAHVIAQNTAVVITMSVAFVRPGEIRRVNRELRDIDRETDVLSIGDYSDDKNIACEKNTDIFLGEIILCYNYIAQTAKENGLSIERELFTVYAHGILHLLGFKHGAKMYALQDAIAEQFSKKAA